MNALGFCLWACGAFLVAAALLHVVKIVMILRGCWQWEADDGLWDALKRWVEKL
jgi:hypothetical protein